MPGWSGTGRSCAGSCGRSGRRIGRSATRSSPARPKPSRTPDFVDVVIHSYRHRLGAAPGDPAYDAIEQRLAAQPVIDVPTIALLGAVDGVNPPQPASHFADHFSRLIDVRVLPKVGHNPPQEAPEAFAGAVLALG